MATLSVPLPLTQTDITALFNSDQSLWQSPLSLETVRGWHAAAPSWSWKYVFVAKAKTKMKVMGENGLSIRDGEDLAVESVGLARETGEQAGLFFAVPLRREAFEELVGGRKMEHEIEPVEDVLSLADGVEERFGVHIFHIERSEDSEFSGCFPSKGYANLCFEQVEKVIDNALGDGGEFLGYSALAVTPDGDKCFSRAGFEQIGGEVAYRDAEGKLHTCSKRDWDGLGERTKICEGKMFWRRSRFSKDG